MFDINIDEIKTYFPFKRQENRSKSTGLALSWNPSSVFLVTLLTQPAKIHTLYCTLSSLSQLKFLHLTFLTAVLPST